jgi:AcrR family transcriptional regulator
MPDPNPKPISEGQMNGPVDPATEARTTARELRRAGAELRLEVRRAAKESRTSAKASRSAALSARDVVRQAIAEAREALKDTHVEIRVERLSREESRQRTRERLLDAAAEVFNRLGYHAASLEAVAEAAGFTKGAVYSNFATKGELFEALLHRYTEQQIDQRAEAMKTMTIDQLAEVGSGVISTQTRSESWDLLQIEFWLAAMRDQGLRDQLQRSSEELYGRLAEPFDAMLARSGAHSAFTGAEFARVANAIGNGLLLQLYLEPDALDPELYGRAIRALAGLPPGSSRSAAAPTPPEPPEPPHPSGPPEPPEPADR